MSNNHYISVMDVWSNVTFVGPFAGREAAAAYSVPTDFDAHVVTEAEYLANIAEFGPAPLQAPEL